MHLSSSMPTQDKIYDYMERGTSPLSGTVATITLAASKGPGMMCRLPASRSRVCRPPPDKRMLLRLWAGNRAPEDPTRVSIVVAILPSI